LTNLLFTRYLSELFKMNPTENEETKNILNLIQNWDKKADIDSKGAAAFTTFLYYFIGKYRDVENGFDRKISKEECLEVLIYTKNYFIKNFDSEEVKLGDIQKIVRGIVEKPIRGMPDVLAAMYCRPYVNGKIQAYQGESYIELVKFPKEGLPIIESVINYGASNHPESPNYADQVDLFLKNETKKMTLDKKQVLKDAVRIYSPK
jgi:acyl-homoserine-lactone acylase